MGLYVAGGALWVISQILDMITGVPWKTVVEDSFELAGSSCLLLALLLAVQNPRSGMEHHSRGGFVAALTGREPGPAPDRQPRARSSA